MASNGNKLWIKQLKQLADESNHIMLIRNVYKLIEITTS